MIEMKAVRALLFVACLPLAGCAGHAPHPRDDAASAFALRLSPASLGRELALQQQLTFRFGDTARMFDGLLEADAGEVRLDIQSLGQSALRLRWDGRDLQQRRADWLPQSVRGEEVLSDLQLANWPVSAIRAGLPDGWTVDETAGVRRLLHGADLIETVRYPAPDRIRIEHAYFKLDIVSVPVQQAPQ